MVYYPRSFRVEHMIVKPGWVSTGLTKRRKVDMTTASVEEEASAIVKSIGFSKETYA
jgi:hypothetical protein